MKSVPSTQGRPPCLPWVDARIRIRAPTGGARTTGTPPPFHSLRGYDYSRTGAYFVTICTQHRECLFGRIVNGETVLNDAGRMVQTGWNEIPTHYPGIGIDALQIMPNHIHGIVAIVVGAGPCACPLSANRHQHTQWRRGWYDPHHRRRYRTNCPGVAEES